MLSVQVCSLISSSAFIPPTLLLLSLSDICHLPLLGGVFFSPFPSPLYVFLHPLPVSLSSLSVYLRFTFLAGVLYC